MNKSFKECAAQSCDRNSHRSENGRAGYCSMHYQRVKKHGDTETVKTIASPAQDWIEDHKNFTGSDCLIWPFTTGKDGYGRIHDPSRGSVLATASNYMLRRASGEPPTPKHECAHSCGKGSAGCVNPRHLYWATPARNHADKIKHGTTNRGERQGQSKLTASDVREIRGMSLSQAEIARRFNVHQSTISNLITRKRWSWLD